MLAHPPVQGHGLAQVSVEDSGSVLEWFVLENIFSSHFGAVKRLKNPTFFPKCCRVLEFVLSVSLSSTQYFCLIPSVLVELGPDLLICFPPLPEAGLARSWSFLSG